FRRQIADAEDPEAMRARMVKEYKSELMHPYYAAERGLVDDVIDPAETREVLIKSLAMLHTKHADLPSRNDVIDPAETREVLIKSLAMLHTKHADLPSRKHGNPPQ
ncbi:carboxyl transferase domain-containing protein, partial [Streptomyces sp. MMCC 100]|uniref:carboxyl transferase domain-containing protein n=1 Tax=Streptomyces sp. MMCC 100 TaxID=3163555 RepID=UPI00359C0D6D